MVWVTSGDEENMWHAEEIDVDLDTSWSTKERS